jgi:hypothetical protein
MKLNEHKVAEQLVNLSEQAYFNPAVFGRYLADQPFYTIDRVMEMVVHIIKQQAERHERELTDNISSEGLILANELYHAINQIKETYQFNNLKLPKSNSEVLAGLQEIKQTNKDTSWLRSQGKSYYAGVNVQAVI